MSNDPVAAYHEGSLKRTQVTDIPTHWVLGVTAPMRLLGPMEVCDAQIIQANIDRFKDLLKTETDATKRTMEKRLLAEEEAKLVSCLPMTRKSLKPIELMAIVPRAPVRRPDVDKFRRYGIDPIGSHFAHREHQRDDIAPLVHHTDL